MQQRTRLPEAVVGLKSQIPTSIQGLYLLKNETSSNKKTEVTTSIKKKYLLVGTSATYPNGMGKSQFFLQITILHTGKVVEIISGLVPLERIEREIPLQPEEKEVLLILFKHHAEIKKIMDETGAHLSKIVNSDLSVL